MASTKTRAKAPQRVRGEVVSEELVTERIQASQVRRAHEQTTRQIRRTPKRKQSHTVDNEGVHTENDSARQVDARQDIDRESEQSSSRQFREPARMHAPPPRPGMAQRWVRFRSGNEEDAEHFDEMLDEGWSPRKRKDTKRVHELVADSHAKYGQYYTRRGMILMEISEQRKRERDRFFRGKTQEQNRGVDKNMFKLRAVGRGVMPLLEPERRTTVTQRARRGRLDDRVPGDEAEA